MSDHSVSSEVQAQSKTEATHQGATLGDLTVGELLQILRNEGVGVGNGAGNGGSEPSLERSLAEHNERVAEARTTLQRVVGLVGPSPADIQVKFLKGLSDHPAEAKKFLDDPRGYAKDHGVLLDPSLVRDIGDAALFGGAISDKMIDRFGPQVVRDIVDLVRPGGGGVNAWPAAVAAIAAVVSAAAAVVAAVTSVTSDHASDLLRLKGLGPNGVMLPGGTRLRPGDFAGGVLGGADAPVVNPGSLVSGGFGGGF